MISALLIKIKICYSCKQLRPQNLCRASFCLSSQLQGKDISQTNVKSFGCPSRFLVWKILPHLWWSPWALKWNLVHRTSFLPVPYSVSISLISGTIPKSIHPIRGKDYCLCFFSCCPDKIPFQKWLKCEVYSVAQFKGTAIMAGKSKRQEREGIGCTCSQVAETNKRWCSSLGAFHEAQGVVLSTVLTELTTSVILIQIVSHRHSQRLVVFKGTHRCAWSFIGCDSSSYQMDMYHCHSNKSDNWML